MLNVNVEGIEDVVSVEGAELFDGSQVIVTFANSYQASIVDHTYSYGTELAVMLDGSITYDTPITDDVIGHLTPESLRSTLESVAALPDPSKGGTIDYWRAVGLVLSVLEAHGEDHSNTPGECAYVVRNYQDGPLVPSCLVGQALARNGVSLKAMNGLSIFNIERVAFEELGATFTDKAYQYLNVLQAIQDTGATWGKAHDYAKRIVGRSVWNDDESFRKL